MFNTMNIVIFEAVRCMTQRMGGMLKTFRLELCILSTSNIITQRQIYGQFFYSRYGTEAK